MYTRAIKVKLYTTKSKQRKIKAIIDAYRKCVNRYLNILYFQGGNLDKETLAKVSTKLSERYKSNALRQAVGIFNGCKNTTKVCPKFNGFPNLDAKFINIENGNNSFDLWIKCSTLAKRKRIWLPSKKHKHLDYWLKKGNLIQGCELHENKLILWVECENKLKNKGKYYAVDMGINKLLTSSDGEIFGNELKVILEEVKKAKGKSRKRLFKKRDQLIDHVVKNLPWGKIKVIFYENIKNLKKGKSCHFSVRHWLYPRIIKRIIDKAEENRVLSWYVNPRNTSRTCPSCKHIDAKNRKGEEFCCLKCGYNKDADWVGAMNILERGKQTLTASKPEKVAKLPKGLKLQC